jgi:hypothetical protein
MVKETDKKTHEERILFLPNKSCTTYIKKDRDRENFSCSTFDKNETHFKEIIEIGK